MVEYNNEWAQHHAIFKGVSIKNGYLAGIIDQLKPSSIIDVGCGSGWLVNQLSRKGYEAFGIDRSKANIDYARAHFMGRYYCGDVEDYTGLKAEMVIMSHVLEHVDDPVYFLREHGCLLTGAKLLLIAVPNSRSYFPTIWRAGRYYSVYDRGHQQHFDAITLREVVEEAGYNIMSLYSRTFRGDVITSLAIGIGRKLARSRDRRIAVASAATASRLVKLWMAIPTGLLDRLNERGMRGSDLILVARKGN